MTTYENIYLQLKNQYRSVYNGVFNPITTSFEFQSAKQKKRLEMIRKARYLFLFRLIELSTPNKADAAVILPHVCFNDRPKSKLKASFADTPCDKRQFVYNAFK